MSGKTHFERALFLAWYCSIGDCSYCYMSTQKDKINEPTRARRRKEAVYAESLIAKLCGWKIEFISGGFDCYSLKEIVEITRNVKEITQSKQWLNIGPLTKSQLESFGDSIAGVAGAVECINPRIRKKVCPSKPLTPIMKMLEEAKNLGLKTGITIIIGLGESESDIPLLIDFIRENKLDRVTFYALNPHKGTPFTKGPAAKYYVKWIKEIRNAFPDLEIIAGSWVDRLDELHELLDAGADAFTKFPSIRLFNSKYAKQIESEVKKSGLEFAGTLTQVPSEEKLTSAVDALDFKPDLKEKITKYSMRLLKKMSGS